MTATFVTVPMNDLHEQPDDVLEKLRSTPVFLARQSEATAVMLSVEHWNMLYEHIDDLECMVEALRVKLDVATGQDEFIPLDPETFNELELELELDAIPA